MGAAAETGALGLPATALLGITSVLGSGAFVYMGQAAAGGGRWTLPLVAAVAALTAASTYNYAYLGRRYGATGRSTGEADAVADATRSPALAAATNAAALLYTTLTCAAILVGLGRFLGGSSGVLLPLALLAALAACASVNLGASAVASGALTSAAVATLLAVPAAVAGGAGDAGALFALPPAAPATAASLLVFMFAGADAVMKLAHATAPGALEAAFPVVFAVTATVYALGTWGVAALLPAPSLRASFAPVSEALRAAGGPLAGAIATAVGGASMLNTVFVLLCAASRLLAGVAGQQLGGGGGGAAAVAALHPRLGTPLAAIALVAAAVALAVLVDAPTALVHTANAGYVAMLLLVNLAALRLRAADAAAAATRQGKDNATQGPTLRHGAA